MDGLSTLTHPGQFLLSLFWIALSWAMWVVLYDCLVWQILPTAPLWNGAFVGSLLALGVAIPSAPAAVGVYEASMTAALVIVGSTESVALAYAILLHVIQFVICAILGIWGLVRDGQSFSSLMSDLKLGRESGQAEEIEPSK
jgi:uncharacterized membrane protein YbhN (UPF0104 family)